jgi:uncharacterized MAPEG superfamily protein
MTPDLSCLIWCVVLAFVQVVIATMAGIAQVGLPELAGNRDATPPMTALAGRAQRAHRNMMENLPLFIALVLVAHAASVPSVLGEQVFFWARVAYAIVYLIGIPWLRTAMWGISVVGWF